MFLVPMSRDSRQLSRLFDETFERFFSPAADAAGVASRSPALDVAENDSAYSVKLEVPGVAKEDVKVSVEGRQVTVQAQSQHTEEKKEGERIVYRERSAVSYARTFTLPLEVDQSQAQAKLDHGVLTLTLPKRGVRGAAQLTVN
jgi:HSP20 family protein